MTLIFRHPVLKVKRNILHKLTAAKRKKKPVVQVNGAAKVVKVVLTRAEQKVAAEI